MVKIDDEDQIKLISAIMRGEINDLLDVYKKYKLGFKFTDPDVSYIFCNCQRYENKKCNCEYIISFNEINNAAWKIARFLYGKNFFRFKKQLKRTIQNWSPRK